MLHLLLLRLSWYPTCYGVVIVLGKVLFRAYSVEIKGPSYGVDEFTFNQQQFHPHMI